MSDSPHSDTVERYNVNGEKESEETLSHSTCPSPSTPISPPIIIKKEKHPPEKASDHDFQSVDKHLAENPDEADAIKKEIKEEPNIQKTKDEQPASAEPIVISTSITTTHVKDLHELCQSHVRLTPFFEFEQRKPQEFSVVLKLVGPEGTKEITVDGTYPSKRHAKEAVSGQGIEYLKNLPKSEGLKSIALETLEKEQENWVALLSGEESSPALVSCTYSMFLYFIFFDIFALIGNLRVYF